MYQNKKRIGMVGIIIFMMLALCVTTPIHAKTKTAKKVTLNYSKKTVTAGKTFTLKVKSVTPKGASKKVTWTSSNKKVATVSKKGVVKGVKKGTAVIYAKANKKTVGKCKVTVSAASVTLKSVTLNYTEKSLFAGESFTLEVTAVKPEKASKKVTWETSNKKIATVSKKGVVKGKSNGTATIYAKADGRTVGKCAVTVTGFKLNETDVVLAKDNSIWLEIEGDVSKIYAITWEVSDTTIIGKFDGHSVKTELINKGGYEIYVTDRGQIKALSVGASVVTVKLYDTYLSDHKDPIATLQCKIRVTNPVLSSSEVYRTIEKSDKLSVFGAEGTAKWASENPNVATVDETGNVQAVGYGTTNITAEVDGTTLKCSYTVEPIPQYESMYTISSGNWHTTEERNKTTQALAGRVAYLSEDGLSVTKTETVGDIAAADCGGTVYPVYEGCWYEKGHSYDCYTEVYMIGSSQNAVVLCLNNGEDEKFQITYTPQEGYGIVRVYCEQKEGETAPGYGIFSVAVDGYTYKFIVDFNKRGECKSSVLANQSNILLTDYVIETQADVEKLKGSSCTLVSDSFKQMVADAIVQEIVAQAVSLLFKAFFHI